MERLQGTKLLTFRNMKNNKRVQYLRSIDAFNIRKCCMVTKLVYPNYK